MCKTIARFARFETNTGPMGVAGNAERKNKIPRKHIATRAVQGFLGPHVGGESVTRKFLADIVVCKTNAQRIARSKT